MYYIISVYEGGLLSYFASTGWSSEQSAAYRFIRASNAITIVHMLTAAWLDDGAKKFQFEVLRVHDEKLATVVANMVVNRAH